MRLSFENSSAIISQIQRNEIIMRILENTQDISRFKSLDSIFRRKHDDVESEFSPYFVRYHRRLFREPDYLNCLLQYVKWWSEVLDISGKDILDVGCGFGVFTMMFSFFGARQVHGVDHNREKIELFKKLLTCVKPPFENVFPSLADGHRLNYNDANFNAVFIKDVISHVRELPPFLDEMNRLLKTGSKMLIVDENNALEWSGRNERRRKWNSWESGEIKPEDVRGGEKPITYREMRREIISNHLENFDFQNLPSIPIILLDSEDIEKGREHIIDRLACLTQGLWGDEVIEGARQILETGELKLKAEFPYRSPITGEMMEREFNPFHLADVIRKHGFVATVIPPRYYTRKWWRNAIGTAIRFTHPLSIFVQPGFYILAVKKA